MATHFVPSSLPPELDADGFPVMSDDIIGTLFVTDQGVIYHCDLARELGTLAWMQVGRLR
ncbi:MAG: hypothetical protein ACYCO3_08360 [Mycobacteriales bacterium]